MLKTTSVYPKHAAKTEIHGEKGSIILTGSKITEWVIEGSKEEKAPDIEDDSEETSNNPNKVPVSAHRPLLVDLIDAVENDRKPMIPPEEARKAVDLILAIYESSRTGREVKLPKF